MMNTQPDPRMELPFGASAAVVAAAVYGWRARMAGESSGATPGIIGALVVLFWITTTIGALVRSPGTPLRALLAS